MLGFDAVGSFAVATLPVPYAPIPLVVIRRARVWLLGPQVQRNVVNTGSSLAFAAEFRDADGQLVAPTSLTWVLEDDCGRVLFGGTIARAGTTNEIAIPAVYTGAPAFYDGRDVLRSLEVTALYNDADTITAACGFRVRRLQ